ncbi:bifunctional phosphoribosylaminoimidazolecarboxamide formyltransferase/IMP cyclohydrolase [candidate division WOR-3 bacterium]|nr:bifunctional phosphoribosylaminoimidazolecarboxamide formyltransferase/IMP cyclohydrolase [candidate division WOR-3 bacterium]
MIKTALISVFDKTGLESIVEFLREKNIKIISTSGSAKFIRENGCKVTEAGDLTGYGEILGGRVKTLHPALFAGILAKRDSQRDMEELQKAKIEPIDLVVVNFYPFSSKGLHSRDEDESVEYIDIGGPSLVRSAAKNHKWVTVLTSPSQYGEFLANIDRKTLDTDADFRKKCASKAFSMTSHYDAIISGQMNDGSMEPLSCFPYVIADKLAYGENPHQEGYFLKNPLCSVSLAEIQPRLSYNNILDAEAALRAVKSFEKPAVAVVKHQTLCGLAEDDDILKAYAEAYETDPDSAFGGIFAINRKIGVDLAENIDKTPFLTMILAPDADDEAKKIITKKKKRIIILDDRIFSNSPKLQIRSVTGGFLCQTADFFEDPSSWDTVSDQKPDKETLKSLVFAQKAVMFVKSNAIVLAKGTEIVGIGGGNVSRVDSVIQACSKAGERSKGSVLASDAFFPFPDSVEYAFKCGVRAIVQPGGSKGDSKVLECADKCGIIMVFSKRRHFYH